MAAKMATKILKISWISYFSIYLGMQYVNSVLNHKIKILNLKIQNGCQNSHQNIENIENAIISLCLMYFTYNT